MEGNTTTNFAREWSKVRGMELYVSKLYKMNGLYKQDQNEINELKMLRTKKDLRRFNLHVSKVATNRSGHERNDSEAVKNLMTKNGKCAEYNTKIENILEKQEDYKNMCNRAVEKKLPETGYVRYSPNYLKLDQPMNYFFPTSTIPRHRAKWPYSNVI